MRSDARKKAADSLAESIRNLEAGDACAVGCRALDRRLGGVGVVSATITIPLPWPKPPLTGNRTRGNPYARANEVKRAKAEAETAIRAAKVRPIVGAEVTLHYRPPTRIRRDADGLFPTLKVVQDALVLCGVLPDDSWVCVPAATCRIHEPGAVAMWVELSKITEFKETP